MSHMYAYYTFFFERLCQYLLLNVSYVAGEVGNG